MDPSGSDKPDSRPPEELRRGDERLTWGEGQRVARRYELQRKLGGGSMGEVWLAEDRLLRKPIALKVLRPELAQSRDTVRRFLREVALAHSVTHPHVVRIYDTGDADGLPFFTMEYLQGQTLEELLGTTDDDATTHDQLSFAEIRDIAFDVLDAMEAAHRVGVIHRDLKPSNVMLTHKGAIVMDFGVAGIEEVPEAPPSTSQVRSLVRTEAGTIFGSPAYMAPELWEGDPATIRSDMYAFGVMVYQMLAGRLPYVATTPAAYLQQLSAGHPPPIRSLRRAAPWTLVRLVRRCLAAVPEHRPASATAAANLIAPLRSQSRRRLAGAVLIAAAAVGAFAVFRTPPTWHSYGLPDALAEADLASAVRAFDTGDDEAALRQLDRLAARATGSAAVVFWRAVVLDELGDDARRTSACVSATALAGAEMWQTLAAAACGPAFALGDPIVATLADGDEAEPPELLPLAVSGYFVPRLEADVAGLDGKALAESLVARLRAPVPDLSPHWAMPIRWGVALADLELARGRIGEATQLFTDLYESHPDSPLARSRGAWISSLVGNSERARDLAAAVRPVDPTPSIRLLLDAGRLDEAWAAIEALGGSSRVPGLRAMWCGYAFRFGTTTIPPRCRALPNHVARSLWTDSGPSPATLSPLTQAIVERRDQLLAGDCEPQAHGAPLITHAPPPFELYLAHLEVEAALCERAPERTDLDRATDIIGRLTGAVPQDPWSLLLRAQVNQARGAKPQAEADRLAVVDRWRAADAYLPRVGRLREAAEASRVAGRRP